jgi:hypothetical protein
MKKIYITILFLIICFIHTYVYANKVETVNTVAESRAITDTIDFHITSIQSSIDKNTIIDIKNADAWIFFDNVKPSEVIKLYSKNILINGKTLDITKNARIAIYRQGAVIIPQGIDDEALTLYEKSDYQGRTETFHPNFYYTNHPDTLCPNTMIQPFSLDNESQSFILKRGYMATFANEPNGLGYSRIYIADDHDIRIPKMPEFLKGKISFIRVIRWQYTSKKGWCGSYWKEIINGLQYAPEQCDATNSTWYYNWGKSRTTDPNNNDTCLNQEFVPEKWGAGGSWNGFFTITNTPHLLGYNEPDHTEQSNVSVETAIKEWPNMMKTGLRLGSPATTDFTWLYSFMSEARKRNYRVDYVAIHAYWGGLSGNEWYARLKEIYEKTGRPLWITEWNNGANWTKEGWPNSTTDQQLKQLSDLKNILTVMDTAHFVERYSIYNWVEDKRAMILKTGLLTPAGEYYTADTPRVAFCHQDEYIPTWTVFDAPVLSYDKYSKEKGLTFTWEDYNGELISRYAIEKSENCEDFTSIDTVAGASYTVGNSSIDKDEGILSFRVKSIPLEGSQQTSNIMNVNIISYTQLKMLCDRLLMNEKWRPVICSNAPSDLLPLLGTATYRNKIPLSWRIRNVLQGSFDLRLTAWDYQQNPSLANPDTIAYLMIPKGLYKANNMTILFDTLNCVNQNWRHFSFNKPFDTTPAVFTTQVTDSTTSATSIRVRNVTNNGFDIKVQCEKAVSPKNISETITYVAATPGAASFLGKTIHVGITPDNAIGDNLSGGYTIHCGTCAKQGLIFANMQTVNDSITSVLRIKQRSDSTVTIIKDREKSTGYDSVKPEQVAWMVVCDENITGFKDINDAINNHGIMTIYDMTGKVLCENCDEEDIRALQNGIYIARTMDKKVFKFSK